jgi:hypothetical protein
MSQIIGYTYSSLTTLELVVGDPIQTLSPQLTFLSTSTLATYNVTPPLPPGLILNVNTGLISGTPTKTQDLTPYVFTATNAFGSFTLTLYIEIYPACEALTCGCDQGYFDNLVVGVTAVKDYLAAEDGEIFAIENYTGSGYLQVAGELLELN